MTVSIPVTTKKKSQKIRVGEGPKNRPFVRHYKIALCGNMETRPKPDVALFIRWTAALLSKNQKQVQLLFQTG